MVAGDPDLARLAYHLLVDFCADLVCAYMISHPKLRH